MNTRTSLSSVIGVVAVTVLVVIVVRADGDPPNTRMTDSAGLSSALNTAEQPGAPACDPTLSDACAKRRLQEGRRLFDAEKFGGNGRTCRTCHSTKTGTFSPEEAQARLAEDPSDALFVHDGLDDGLAGTSRITEHATVRIEIPLPSSVVLANDPARRSVILNRGTPTTRNTPALDPILMYDTREPNLQQQAFNAIHGHAQNTREPTALELDLIKEFQQTDSRFFSSEALRAFANGGPPPQLPPGATESEKRGRAMFDDVPFDGVTTRGLCNTCHSGPMLNQFAPGNPFGGPPGGRRAGIGVEERNLIGNPVYTFIVTNQDGSVVVIDSPDPGAMLNDPPPSVPPGVPTPPRSFFATLFKIPPLWGVRDTAPYFHDNSAKTLEDVMEHYEFFFLTSPGTTGFVFTKQDQGDAVAFLKLLR
jgi:cytochrome c peroxidase